MGGMGAEYLSMLLETAASQEGVDFKVIVSDQSDDSEVEDVCGLYEFVEYHRFEGPRNPCDNLNHCISKSDARVVKIMFQDDFFYPSKDSLLKCVEPILDGKCTWTASACLHTYDNGKTVSRPMIPRYHSQIHMGVNTISSPSVVAFKREDDLNVTLFDPNISLLLDVDWYKRMEYKHGLPFIVDSYNVVNRIHENSISNTANKETEKVLLKEQEYIREKYERTNIA